jgi:uncharacterized membrane protein YccC
VRSTLARLRKMLAKRGGRATPVYGLVTATGVTAPLVVGLLTGRTAESHLVALGAFYVGLATPRGPYGARARSMLTMVGVVTVFTWLGGAVSDRPWLAVVVISAVSALSAVIRWLGPIASLCTLVAALRPSAGSVVFHGFLEALGGLWLSALLLVPWITHRLRPLRTSLAEAGRLVADALDVLADPGPESDEWYDRRKEAYAAIRSAREMYGLSLDGQGDEQDRSVRMIDAIQRVMDQTVALRSLLIAVRRKSPPEDWLTECRAAITALAARLRNLGEAIERGTGVPDDDHGVALDRLAAVTREVRRAWLAGEADVVLAALILQIRRTIGRIAATAECMSEIVAHGLELGIIAPGLPERPTGVWAGVKEAVATLSPEFRHAARVGTAMAVSITLVMWLKPPYPYWLTLTVLFSLRDTYGNTVDMVLERVAGTTLGATVAAVALAVAPERVTLIAMILIGGAAGFTLKSVNTTYWFVLGTPMTMLLIDFTAPLTWTAAVWRIGLTLVGGLLALAFARLLWPAGGTRLLPRRLVRLLRTHAELARAVAARLDGDRKVSIRDRLEEAAEAAAEVEQAITRLEHEPTAQEELIERLKEADAIAQRLRDYFKTLGTLTEEEPREVGPIPATVERVADYLEEGADALLHRKAPSGQLSPGDLLDELDAYLSELTDRRRAELAGGVGPEAITSLRRSLVDVAAAQYAVRALVADAERLRKVAQEAAAV